MSDRPTGAAPPVPPVPEDPGWLAERVAAVVLAHPAVAGLHGGPFGTIASYLPGRRLVGVRVGEAPEPVEVSVVLRLGAGGFPEVAAQLRAALAGVLGAGRQVAVTVSDVVTPAPGSARWSCAQPDTSAR